MAEESKKTALLEKGRTMLDYLKRARTFTDGDACKLVGGPAPRHKAPSERILLAARAKLGAVLENNVLDDHVRDELGLVAALLLSAEEKLGGSRLRNRGTTLLDVEEDPSTSCSTIDLKPQQLDLERIFTEIDAEAAEGNHMLTPSEGCRPGIRRMSTDDELAMLKSDKAADLLVHAGKFTFDALAFQALPEAAVLNARRMPNTMLFSYVESGAKLFKGLKELYQVDLKPEVICFLEQIDSLYREDVPYHNAAHGADVMMTMDWLFRSEYLRTHTLQLDRFMGLIAAAIHDVGHPGRTQLFAMKTMAPMAIRYNDRSVLENMHLAISFEKMLATPSCNWFSRLPREFETEGTSANLQQYVRKGLVDMVLATDMSKHAKHVYKFKAFVESVEAADAGIREEGPKGDEAPGDRHRDEPDKQHALEMKMLVLETALHLADISNPTKCRPVMLKWTERILTEYWAQGDEELRLGLPVSPLCDRETGTKTVPKGQLGFINFVIQPLFMPFARLVPEVQEALDSLGTNRAFWEEKDKEGAPLEAIFV
mmetsp:Transcript_35708/g.100409  ORF Transcript_35708/g.100409 Transcript_35708/m.100409 type:complete len:541 (+) Transcript_35708:71-1693(+)